MGDIVVWAPDADHAFELLAGARTLAPAFGGKVVALAFGDLAPRAGEFFGRGADRVLTNGQESLKGLQVEPYADALHDVLVKLKPAALLVGSTIRSRDAAARAATRLEVGVGSEHTNLRVEGGRLVGDRPYFSGNSILTERLLRDPQIVCVPARAYEAAAPDAKRTGMPEEYPLDLKPAKAKLLKAEKKATEGVHLEDAPIVVSVGRGLKKKEDLAMVEDLARAMGAVVGCTRPIAADLKWLGDDHWIGLSGHEVRPKAYIGLGVSGQIQHVAGMRGSKLIVAINKDEEAPLVKIADYAIVDDLYKVVPALAKEVKRARGQS